MKESKQESKQESKTDRKKKGLGGEGEDQGGEICFIEERMLLRSVALGPAKIIPEDSLSVFLLIVRGQSFQVSSRT